MQKNFYHLVAAIVLLLCLALAAHAFGGALSTPTAEQANETGPVPDMTLSLRMNGSEQIEQVSLFSQKHAQTPVAMVNEEPITLMELATELAAMHGNMEKSENREKLDFTKLLERLITIKLVKQEALNIGFDRTPAFQKQVNDYALKNKIQLLMNEQFKNIQLDEQKIEETYQEMAIEAKLTTYSFADKTDADSFLDEYKKGGDFKELAALQVKQGKAAGGNEEEYVKLIDLLPPVAQAVFTMDSGAVSEVFKGQDNYLLFRLEDKRVYEDADVRLAATNRVYQNQAKEAQVNYFTALREKYVVFDKEAEKALDFASISAENPQVTGTEVFARLSDDQRPLATISVAGQTESITVAEIAEKVKAKMFHGTQKVIDAAALDNRKEVIIHDRIIAITGDLEARKLGVDKTEGYLKKLEKHKERLLFDTFLAKAVIPEIRVPEDEARQYYFNNLEDYATPLMLKMKPLVFTSRTSAEAALAKLRSGNDFKWVSSNSKNLADINEVNALSLGGSILAVTALPEDLQKMAGQARQGDTFLYAGPEDLFYLLTVENAYPSRAKLYEEVRQEVGRIIYARKIDEALQNWVAKLKEAYETEIYIVQDKL